MGFHNGNLAQFSLGSLNQTRASGSKVEGLGSGPFLMLG